MLLAILFVCIASVASKHGETKCSTCIKVDSICYNIVHLFNLEAPFRNTVVITKMGILHSKNTLYYAFEPKITDPEYYKIGYVNLDNTNISGIVNGSKLTNNFATFDIDQDHNKIYVGGSDGIYVLDDNNKASFYSYGGSTITNVFYKGNVYFVADDVKKIMKKRDDGEFSTYEDIKNVKNFIIDNNNNLVYISNTGLYATKLGTNNTVYLSKNAYFRGLVNDLDGVVYAWWVDGIYKIVIDNLFIGDSTLVKVANINNLGALTFDNNDNFIFNSGKGLFRLTKTTTPTSC